MWVQKWSKIIFSKFVYGPLGVLKQVFLACFESMVARFDPHKLLRTLENGLFWATKKRLKWVKNVFFQKCY